MLSIEVLNSVKALKRGGTLLYPTDTIWGIGCDATNAEAVDKVYKLKNRAESKSLIILVHDFESIKDYIEEVPPVAEDLVKNAQKPLTIIYSGAKNLAPNVIAEDGTIAIRVIKHEFCEEMIKVFGKPIVSTSANLSGQANPLSFNKISDEIIENVDHIVNLHESNVTETKPSTIIKLLPNNEFVILRD